MEDVIMQNPHNVAEMEPQLVAQRQQRPDKTANNICDDPNCDMCYQSIYLKQQTYGSYSQSSMENIDEKLGDGAYFDNGQGTTLQLSLSDNNLRVEDVVNSIINNQNNLENRKDEIMSGLNDPKTKQEDIIGTSNDQNLRVELVDEDSDEEVIELEFERAFKKVHTHTPFCPKCSSRITKVVLRRRKRERHETWGRAFGCLSCLKIFIPKGIFGSKPTQEGSSIGQENPLPDANANANANANENPNINNGNDQNTASLHVPLLHGNLPSDHNTVSSQKPGHTQSPADDIEAGRGELETDQGNALISDINGSKVVEILKCIVHGGLMEAIASLGVVSSAAASDATSLSIISMGLATLMSALIIFGQNLMDLKKDSNKYQELLGRRVHFLLHSTFAIFSFIIFGLIPPVVYGFAFRESDNKDYKILAVAVASFVCILILAIAKTYVKPERKFTDYIKNVTYYMTMAISVSGVGYAAGDLFKILMERAGLFEPAAPAGLNWQSY